MNPQIQYFTFDNYNIEVVTKPTFSKIRINKMKSLSYNHFNPDMDQKKIIKLVNYLRILMKTDNGVIIYNDDDSKDNNNFFATMTNLNKKCFFDPEAQQIIYG